MACRDDPITLLRQRLALNGVKKAARSVTIAVREGVELVNQRLGMDPSTGHASRLQTDQRHR
jgi:hypothetical protein